jgi:hypothetical protein
MKSRQALRSLISQRPLRYSSRRIETKERRALDDILDDLDVENRVRKDSRAAGGERFSKVLLLITVR